MGGLGSTQIRGLSAEQIKTLSTTQMVALTTRQEAGLTVQDIKAWSAVQIRSLSSRQIKALTDEQVGALSVHVGQMSSGQMAGFETGDFAILGAGLFNTEQVDAMSRAQKVAYWAAGGSIGVVAP